MKKILIGTICFAFLLLPSNAKAELNPKMKALAIMATYGTIGGALLGTASLAFGTEGRSVAKGASLGLYAGLLFGSYVVISHAYRKHQKENPNPNSNYYPDTSKSPYEKVDEGGGSSWFDFGGGDDEDRQEHQEQRFKQFFYDDSSGLKRSFGSSYGKKSRFRPVIFIPILHYQF